MRQSTGWLSRGVLVVLLASLVAVIIWFAGRSNYHERGRTVQITHTTPDVVAAPYATVPTAASEQIRLKGRVIGQNNRPIEGTEVSAQLLSPLGNTAILTLAAVSQPEPIWTDETGTFEFTLPKSDFDVILLAFAENYGRGRLQLQVHGQSIEGLEIILSTSGSISGRVFDAKHRPMEHVALEARSTAQSTPTRCESRTPTAADGSFTIGGLAAAEYTLHARYVPPSRKKNWTGGIPVETVDLIGDAGALKTVIVHNGEAVEGVEIIVPWDFDRSIEGVVLDEASKPVVGAVVWAESSQGLPLPLGICTTITADDGRFRISYIRETTVASEPRVVSIRGQAEGYERGLVEQVAVGDRNVRVVLMKAARGSIAGQVIDAGSREPINTAKVMLETVACEWGEQWNSPNYLNPHHDDGVSPRGTFEIEDVPAGIATLKVYAPEYGMSTVGNLVVRSGETTNVEIPLSLGGILKVNIRTGGLLEGMSFHDFSLDCWPIDRVGDWSSASDYKIHEAIRGNPISPNAEEAGTRTMTLPPSRYAVTVFLVPMLSENQMFVPAEHFAYGEAVVESGETTYLDLDVGGTGAVSGYLVPQQDEILTVSLAPGKDTNALQGDFPTAFKNAATFGTYFRKRMKEPGPFLFLGIPEGTYTATLSVTSKKNPDPCVLATKIIELVTNDEITLEFP